MRAISAKSVSLAPYLFREERRCQLSVLRVCCRGLIGVSPLLHILPPGISKHLRRARRIRHPPRNPHHLPRRLRGPGPILKETLQLARKHLLKSHHHDTIRHAVAHHVPCHMQTRRTSGAVVVDIIDRDLGHAELIENALAAGAVAVAVAGDALVDIVIVNLGIEEGFDAGFEAEFGVVDCMG